MQLHAGFISSALHHQLLNLKDDELKLKLEGLLSSLCVFDVTTSNSFNIPNDPNPYLSVLYNAISRGIPSIVSPDVEIQLAQKLGFTLNESDNNVFNFSLAKDFDVEKFFKLLHPADPRYIDREKYLNTEYADSNFEKAFLMDFLPKELAILFDQQRARNTLGAAQDNQGRVDFSLEIPYFGIEQRENRFRQQAKVKTRKKFIVEVDGTRYHEDLIDDMKDHEIAQFRHDVNHVREASSFNDAKQLIEQLLKEDFIKQTLHNLSSDIETKVNELSFVFSPIGIARIQKTIFHHLINNPSIQTLSIAVIERDVPCAILAIEDMNNLLSNLANIVDDFLPPKFDYEVFTTTEFLSSPLHNGLQKLLTKEFNASRYDLVLDIALLNKSYIVNYPFSIQGHNVYTIRNSHFENPDFSNKLVSAAPIKYKELVKHIGNEQYDPIDNVVSNIEYFIQFFFRKKSFRDGQLPIINRALSLKSVIGLLPTGGGKSLTYQLVALLQPGCTIIVDPIKSLMFDQFKSLKEIGITRAVFINSSLSASEKNYATKGLENGAYQFVFVSPERYVIEKFREGLLSANQKDNFFSYVVIDEVHCVSEWGHDFRTPYLDLGENAIKFTHTKTGVSIPLIGLTATASFDVLADIERELRIKDDDGNAIIRFENTVRDEVNYKIVKSEVNFEGIMLHSRNIRNHIGASKSNQLVDWLKNIKNELGTINSKEYIKSITKQSYENFLPNFLKTKNSENKKLVKFPTYQDYHESQLKNLKLDDLNWKTADELYLFGAVLFCPHKSGSHGVHNLVDDLGINMPEINTGYFVGGNEGYTEEISFDNQEKFINNELGVMVATKAFGMGIDKSNVRATAHINVPQSIESFVQEAGRAGRDKKMALSLILLNNQKVELFKNDDENAKELIDFWSDREILMFFHKNSFKGKLKERQTLFELRSAITFPSVSRLELMQYMLNEALEIDYISLKFGNGNHQFKIFANDFEQGETLGYLDLEYNRTGNYPYLNPLIQSKVLNTLKSFANQTNIEGHINLKNNLFEYTVRKGSQTGIEKKLSEMEIGEKSAMQIPFENKYISLKSYDGYGIVLNPIHLAAVMKTATIKEALEIGNLNQISINSAIKKSLEKGFNDDEFIEILAQYNQELIKQLDKDDLKRAFLKPRSQEDTSKAIFRLISLGVIDGYTIDYQNKIFNVEFEKKQEGFYFDKLQSIIARYSSSQIASKSIDEFKSEKRQVIIDGKATEISVCIEFLTDFIYDRIADKRKRAIDDMLGLCKRALTLQNDPIKQNLQVKEEIYYYFNAKYSRFKNQAIIKDTEEPASLLDDHEEKIDSKNILWKYINIVEVDSTGSFIDNIKHLRGASMRMIRAYDDPIYIILKAYTLFVLSDRTVNLLDEASQEMINGFSKKIEAEDNVNIQDEMYMIIERLLGKVTDIKVIQALNELKNAVNLIYYTAWTKKFRKKITQNIDYD